MDLAEQDMSTLTYNPPERRRHPRTKLQMMLHGIRLDPDGGDVRDTLQMVDISRGGMGALVDRWLHPGQRIVLSLPLGPEGRRRNVFASIVRCQKVQQEDQIGLEFDLAALGATAGYTAVAAAA
jgi:hypothetical protein